MNKNEEMFTDYQYGFSDKDVSIFKTDKGLTKEIVKTISERKEEPKWMLEYRLNALKEFYRMPMPTWGGDLSEIDFEDLTYYVKPSEKTERSWDEVPEEIKNTFEKLGIPEAEQKLLVNNKDATQYVLGYLAGQEATPFEQGETVEINRKFPYYIQWDKRWAYDKLGGTNVAIGGCGPTCVAMALSGILDDKSITPKNIAEKENASGHFTDAGTKWSFFDYIAKEYGVKSTGILLNEQAMKSALSKGHPIIASVRPGKFTTVGHIILITGVDDEGKFIINDPNSYTRTLKKWSFNELRTEIVAMWEFSK